MQQKPPPNPSAHAAPPPFAMPMFRDFVPRSIRPWIYVLLAFCFQFSNGVYLGAQGHIIGGHALMREDVLMCLYATLAGMAFYFPLLFRMKFRFTNQQLLITAAATIFVCNMITCRPLPPPVTWIICFVCGMAKIQGTFECMSNIQLWMTPKRDFGVFFPILHIILLTSMEVTAYIAAIYGEMGQWQMMHYLVCGLMLAVILVQGTLCRPFRAMPKIVPLKGVDWFGALLWALLALQVVYLFTYGDWLDWWDSRTFRYLTGTSLITLVIAMRRMATARQPYYEPAMWRYRHVVPIIVLVGIVETLFATEHVLEHVFYEEVMHYDELTFERLNQWALPGIWAGCLFSLGWLRLMRWNAYKLIALGLFAFVGYAAGFHFLVADHINMELLRLPIVFRGFAYAVLSISFMWCLHEIMSFQHFFQALSIFNILHMFIGGSIGCALHSFGLRYYVADGLSRYSGSIDGVSTNHDVLTAFPHFMENFIQSLMAQSVKTLFGWVLWFALFFALLMLLWDIPGVRRRIKHIPSWPRVGVQIWNKVRRRRGTKSKKWFIKNS